MPVMMKEGKRVLFVHIPKCGGSSLEKELSVRGWRELLSIRGVHTKDLAFIKCSLQHMHGEQLRYLLNLTEFDEIISVVRNPFDRLRSEYYWQLHQKMVSLSPAEWIVQTLERYHDNPFIYDNHIRPQSEFLLNGMKWFKLEEGGVKLALETVDKSLPRKSFIKSLLKQSKSGHLKRTLKSESIDRVFEEHKKLIVDFYREDYEILGYSY